MRITFLGNFKVNYTSETHHAATLEALGHNVIRLQESSADAAHIEREAVHSDLFVWIHTHGWETPGIERVLEGCRRFGIPTVTYHLDLWNGLARWRDVRNGPYWSLDHFFTVDKLMSDWLNENTPVRGHFIPAGVYHRECYISSQSSAYANDVIFVGSRRYHPEWPWRVQLVDWLQHTYGDRFTHIGPDSDTGPVRGDALNRLYSNSKVAVGDTLCVDYEYPYYASDRLFEAPGRGAFQIFPRITGLDEWFTDGETIRFFDFQDFDGLKAMIDHYLVNDVEREQIRKQANEHVLQNHTYLNRWETILGTVFDR